MTLRASQFRSPNFVISSTCLLQETCSNLFLKVRIYRSHLFFFVSLVLLCSFFSDFSATMLQTLLVDMNSAISYIPVSLAPLSWWGMLGVEGCPVHVKEENLSSLKPLNTCGHVPALIELTARFLHGILRSRVLLHLTSCYLCNFCFSMQRVWKTMRSCGYQTSCALFSSCLWA